MHMAAAKNAHPPPHVLETMSEHCTHCHAIFFPSERNTRGQYTLCCRSGLVHLPPQPITPPYLRDLFEGNTLTSVHFNEHAAQYNNALSFTSIKADFAPPPGFGVPIYRINNQMSHNLSPLTSHGYFPIQHSQIYFIDDLEGMKNAAIAQPAFGDLQEGIVRCLLDTLHPINKYIKHYETMLAIVREQEAKCLRLNIDVPVITFTLVHVGGNRTGNLPQVNEVAVLHTIGDDDEPPPLEVGVYPKKKKNPYPLDVHIRHTGKGLNTLNTDSPHIDPMSFPLLFPEGNITWSVHMPHKPRNGAHVDDDDDLDLEGGAFGEDGKPKRKRGSVITRRECSCYLMHQRTRHYGFESLLQGGRLTQRFNVWQHVRREENDVRWVKENQATIRVSCYRGMADQLAAHNDGLSEAEKIGKIIVLPSTFQGSKRWYEQNYQDAIATTVRFGKPTYFITLTANPKWPEIEFIMNEKEHKQQSFNRPDIVTRCFDKYKKTLLTHLLEKEVLGKPIAWVWVIEFQKRGLPHLHLVLTVDNESRPRDADAMDRVIQAEIPLDPADQELVRLKMIHGPCGKDNPNSPCMENGKCSKKFPFDFREETLLTEEGTVLHRRPDNGRTVRVGKHLVNNRWVVPHNLYLLRLLQSHVNILFAFNTHCIKYLYKYICKGFDWSKVQVDNPFDEITRYLIARYVSPTEACWHTFAYKMHDRSHAITRLAVHTEDEQLVYFREGEEMERVEAAAIKDTTLLGYFKLNERDPRARKFTYTQIVEEYWFHKNEWKRRINMAKGQKAIGRMYQIGTKDIERFHLRILLLHRKGATSFADLRTIDGVEFPSFRLTCKALGILQDDTEWENCLQEASTFAFGPRLRSFFVGIVVHNNPSDPVALWEKFQKPLSDDYIRRFNDPQIGTAFGLQEVRRLLQDGNVNLEAMGFPDYDPELIARIELSTNEYDAAHELIIGEQLRTNLNVEQREAFDAIWTSVRHYDPNNKNRLARTFALTAPGGCGKTTLYKALIHYARGHGKNVIACASAGIAATLLPGGKTAHSTFSLPIPIQENSTCNIGSEHRMWKLLKKTHLIIWDEAPMCSKKNFKAVDRTLRDVMGPPGRPVNVPFGGIPFLIGGDFAQLLPVVKNAQLSECENMSIKRCTLWSHFREYKLATNMRAANGVDADAFRTFLLELANGTLHPYSALDPDIVLLPQKINFTDNIQECIFPANILQDRDIVTRRAILCSTNEESQRINKIILDKLPGETKSYISSDSIAEDDDEADQLNIPVEQLHKLTPPDLPPHELNLKVGCLIMCLQNFNAKQLCNGTRLIVRELFNHVIVARVITDGGDAGEDVLIPRVTMIRGDSLKIKRTQFPVRVCYSITINKSQGQTYETVGIFLPSPVFSHGQLYVACSRAKSWAGLFMQISDSPPRQGITAEGRYYTRNVVCRSILT
jgi:hypothetical protein